MDLRQFRSIADSGNFQGPRLVNRRMLCGRKEAIADFLLPRSCCVCWEDLSPPLAGPLCGRCLRHLSPMNPPWCGRCGRQLKGGGRCRDCRGMSFSLDCIRAAFPYRGPVPTLLHAFKYRGWLSVGRALAGWMAGMLPRYPELWGADAVVPVPLHPKRQTERGFNQAAILAREVIFTYPASIREILERRRNTPPQWRLTPAQRSGNLRDAFRVNPVARLGGTSLLLIDDVCTTGATLENCAQALKAAGAARVSAFVMARS